jgi:hypothetical protein
MLNTPIGGKMRAMAEKQAAKMLASIAPDAAGMLNAMMEEMPLCALGVIRSGSMPPNFAELIVPSLNVNPSPKLVGLLG